MIRVAETMRWGAAATHRVWEATAATTAILAALVLAAGVVGSSWPDDMHRTWPAPIAGQVRVTPSPVPSPSLLLMVGGRG